MRRLLIIAFLLAASPALGQSTLWRKPAPPTPTYADLAYAPADPAASRGHLLDLYLPRLQKGPAPVVIWTGGSAWLADNGKDRAGWLAPALNRAGYAVAGVSVRASSEIRFPGQLHDIKAAIRWLRFNAKRYDLDPNRIAVMGDSSGGWTAAMAALTGDVPELEGDVGETGISSAVQAAIAFYPPTRFIEMDRWALRPCKPGPMSQSGMQFCHDGEDSPESRLIGCPIQDCPGRAERADPVRYISAADPPIMILHGESDPLVPHAQGEWLYQALNKACHDAVFVSLPKAGHGPPADFLLNPRLGEGATIRSTSAEGCRVMTPEPYRPGLWTILNFLDAHLKAQSKS